MTLGHAGLGKDGQGRRGDVSQGSMRFGKVRHGRQSGAGQGEAEQRMDRQGRPRWARRGIVRRGKAQQCRHGGARKGMARSGEARQASQGPERQGGAGLGLARQAGQRMARPGEDWHGMARQLRVIRRRKEITPMKEIKVQYGWADGLHHKTNAAAAAVELERIRKERGLTATAVIEESRPETAPLHNEFEWNDETAANKFRLDQARHLIRDVLVVRAGEKPVPMFVHVKNDGNSGNYIPVTTLVQHTDMYDIAVQEAQLYLQSARDRLFGLLALRPSAPNIESAIASVEQAQLYIQEPPSDQPVA